jgi:site-specific recombinase XerD
MIAHGTIYDQIDILQPKTNKRRITIFTKELKNIMQQELKDDVNRVFPTETSILGWSERSKNKMTETQWIITLNKFIQPAVKHFGLVLSSHSFRINFITQLTRTVPLQQVKDIIGRQSIQTTLLYNRFRQPTKDTADLIDRALLHNQSKRQKTIKRNIRWRPRV